MNKDVLVALIAKDVNELQTLTEGLDQMPTIPAPYLRLALDKSKALTANIESLINYLDNKEIEDKLEAQRQAEIEAQKAEEAAREAELARIAEEQEALFRAEELERERQAEARRKAEEERKLAEYKRTHGSINGYEYADLGLSVKWATCNIGANTPEDYGNYYDWSEISTVSDGPSYYSETFHRTMNIDIGGNPKYDAARAHWGGSWRLPTKKEMEELINNCKWYRMTRNGIYGCDVVGPNGNSIFLPAAGYRFSSIYLKGTNGLYWSSTPNSNDFGISPSTLEFDAEKIKTHYRGRTHGLAIRPVSY